MSAFNEYFWNVVKKRYFDFNGSATQKEFWLYVLFSNIVILVALLATCLLFYIVGTPVFLFAFIVFVLALLIPSIGITVRRLHETKRSGLLLLIPVLILIFAIFFKLSYSLLLFNIFSDLYGISISIILIFLISPKYNENFSGNSYVGYEINRYFLDVVKNQYFDFRGRATRTQYWMFTYIFSAILSTVLFCSKILFLYLLGLPIVFLVVVVIACLAVIIPSICICIRRLHDTNRSGWWYGALLIIALLFCALMILYIVGNTSSVYVVGLFALVLAVLSIIVFVFYLLPGTEGTNKYGDPVEN